jgi:hypothetical protein
MPVFGQGKLLIRKLQYTAAKEKLTSRYKKYFYDFGKPEKAALTTKGPHRPDAIRQRDANFQFSKTNKTVNG